MESTPSSSAPDKWTAMVRVKPLMDDEIIYMIPDEKDKVYKGAEGNTCFMNFTRGEEKFELDKVIHPEENQESTYNNMMQGYIENFMNGYNVTISAAGQTGSGKTYTMIAPVGSIKKKGGHDMGGAVLEHYGIFPRTVLHLYNLISGMGPGHICTLSLCQMGGWAYFPIDLVTGEGCYFDYNDNFYFGLTETIIKDPSDIIKYLIILEQKRSVDSTKMNSTSSRTNAMLDFKWYKKKDADTLNIQTFRFIDMAGSERIEKAGADSGPKWRKVLSLAAVTNNMGLGNF